MKYSVKVNKGVLKRGGYEIAMKQEQKEALEGIDSLQALKALNIPKDFITFERLSMRDDCELYEKERQGKKMPLIGRSARGCFVTLVFEV
jgi:hypothetical protein